MPDVLQLPMASAHAYAREGLLSRDAAQEVVDRLGEETFSSRALSLMTSEGTVTAVPSDGWGQLLIYRKDLFDGAGLPAPRTLKDVVRAARRLRRPLRAGIALGTAATPFTAETFEHVALGAGCQLLDDAGKVALDSPECVDAFEIYVELARTAPRPAGQDVESTRDDYFAGDAAMVFWSPFLLDAMAGLRDEAMPTCPQCREDPAFLARASGLVGPLATAGAAAPAQFGTLSGWGSPRTPRRGRRGLRGVHDVRRVPALARARPPGASSPCAPGTGPSRTATSTRGRGCRAEWSARRR
jgi:multiple sugar transport system substrate-binding protein